MIKVGINQNHNHEFTLKPSLGLCHIRFIFKKIDKAKLFLKKTLYN